MALHVHQQGALGTPPTHGPISTPRMVFVAMGGFGSWWTRRSRVSGLVGTFSVAPNHAQASPPSAKPSCGHAMVKRTVRCAAGRTTGGTHSAKVGAVQVAFRPRKRRTCRITPTAYSRGQRVTERWMRGEASPQRGQLAVGVVARAVIVRTRSLWLTAVISHPGKQKADGGRIKAQLPTQGNTQAIQEIAYGSIPQARHFCLSTKAAGEPNFAVHYTQPTCMSGWHYHRLTSFSIYANDEFEFL